ncbi:hypothetical protein KO493_09725 [Tamlana agarivorans]|uniref:Uncharacterized protein n=1 Tax=Pseudotamlana agarivorans TaxID=481183 RepID=A0ACC5U9H0_9FLAO|nr:hypothetical protein [Tamlana agarivorans]MBU2950977.1 hypothetical protein [Tamlana agarivorans]
MNNIKLIPFFIGLLFIVSCEDEYADYTPPQDDFADVSWLVGLNPSVGVDAQFAVNQDTGISFFNLAQGAVSSEWIITGEDKFLKEGWNNQDSIPLFIDESAGLTSSKGKAHIMLRNSLSDTITLINKFKQPVSSNMSDAYEDSVLEKEYEEDGLFVYETKFVFDVYAYLNPAFSVFQDGNEILTITEDDMPSLADQDNWPVVEVEAGNGLTIVNNSTEGRPNGATWFSPNGVPAQSGAFDQATIKFFKQGTFNAGRFRSMRVSPLPTSNSEKLIPLKVKVIQSSQPFTFDGALEEAQNETISFRVNGEVVPFSGQENSFTVSVKNGNGFNQNIPVANAKVSDDNPIFIELELSQPIYNSDEITVSYTGTGIESLDQRTLEPFGPELVAMNFGNNVLPSNAWGSFELDGGGVNNAYASSKYYIPPGQGNDQYGDLIYERVTTRSYTGGASMQYKLPDVSAIPVVNLFGFGLADPSGLSAGTYNVSMWVYVEPGTTLQGFKMEFGNPIYEYDVLFDISSIDKGKWVKVDANIPLVIPTDLGVGDANRRTTLRVLASENPGVTGPQLMYFDELSLVPVEVRP